MYSRLDAESRQAIVSAAASAGLMAALALAGGSTIAGIAVLAVVVAVAVVSPIGVVCAALVALPYFYRPIEIGAQSIAASELLLAAALAGVALRVISEIARNRHDRLGEVLNGVRRITTTPIFWLALAITVLGALLVVWPFDPAHRADSLREWRWALAEPLALLVVLLWLRPDDRQRRILAGAFVAGAVLASLHGLTDLVGDGGLSVGGVRRIDGPYPHPNALAIYLARGFAFSAAWWWFDRSLRWLLAPAVAICGTALVLTFSRGALAAAVIALGVIAWRATPRVRLYAGIALAVGMLLLGIVARERMFDAFEGGSGSLRADVWSSTLQMIRDRPVQGYGPDQFLYAYNPRYVEPTSWGERFTAHPHNVLLDFQVRLGIIGGAFAMIVAVGIVLAAFRVARDTGPQMSDALASAATLALLAALVHGMVDRGYFLHDLAISAWILAWIAFGAGARDARERAVVGASTRRRWRGLHRVALV